MLAINTEDKLLKIQKYLKNDRIFRYSPSFKKPILSKFRSLLILQKRINFLIYWGVGNKKVIDNIDMQAMHFQSKWINAISNILELDYHIQYIITDTHAMINGISTSTINSYSISAQDFLQNKGYDTILMTKLLKSYNINNIRNFMDKYSIDHIIKDTGYKSLLNGLKIQANSPYHRGDSIEYLKSNLIENAIIEDVFSKYIFVSYGVPETKLLLPNLPKLYTYVDEKKQIKRPWFNEG